MSSTAKGDKFEANILEYFERAIANSEFYALAERCQIFPKKTYPSIRRKKGIKFDIAIETFRPGSTSRAMLVLIECKDHGRAVSVGELQKFHDELQQVSAQKGIFVSTSGFQQGAKEFADSTKIALIRYFDKSTVQWILERSPSLAGVPQSLNVGWMDVHDGLTRSDYESRFFEFYCCWAGEYTNSLNDLFANLLEDAVERSPALAITRNPRTSQQEGVQFVREETIERMVDLILDQIGYSTEEVAIDAICSWQSGKIGLSVKTGITPGPREIAGGILGRMSFDPLEITVFACPDGNTARQRFTLAHELGHHFLGHSKYMLGEYCAERNLDLKPGMDVGLKDIGRMEWQANYFASCLLLPRRAVIVDFLDQTRKLGLQSRGSSIRYVDHQRCNQISYYALTNALMRTYHVSRKAVAIRLEGLSLLQDARSAPTSLGNTFANLSGLAGSAATEHHGLYQRRRSVPR